MIEIVAWSAWLSHSSVWKNEPVYHDLPEAPWDGHTVCGIDWWERDEDGRYQRARGELLPKKHVVKFARRCQRCARRSEA